MRPAPSRLLIGWSEIDTTPGGTVDLCGQYYHRVSTGIHSRLSVTALALEAQSGEQAVMVSLELVGIEADFQEEVRARVQAELPEIAGAKVFLNVTHTHNAPAISLIEGIGWLKELPGVMPALEYRKFLRDKVVEAVGTAWKNRQPGGIGNALAAARVGHCRRAMYANGTAEMYGSTRRDDFIGMEGGEDSGLDLLFTFDGDRRPTGVILNLACPAQVMEATCKISSDFIGEARQRLKECFGETFRTLGQISAAGCQAPRDLTRNGRGEPDFWHAEGVVEIGKRLAGAVEQACLATAAKVDFAPVLRHEIRQVVLPRRRASYPDYLVARRNLAALEATVSEEEAYRQFCDEVGRNEKIHGRPGPYDSKLHPFVLMQNNLAVIRRYESQDATPTFEFEMHVLRLGAVAFATNPFELYLDFGHQIKARSAAEQTFIVQLCGGTGGYLPNARAEELGGYGGLIINGMVGSDGGRKLVDQTVETIATLWG